MTSPVVPGWATGEWQRWPLLQPDLSASLDEQGRGKPVHARQVIDDMESELDWRPSPVVELSYETDRARTGSRSLRLSTLLRNPDYIAASRQENGTFSGQAVLFDGQPLAASATLHLSQPQDWSRFNRISFWCYVHPTDTGAIALAVQFLCDGATSGPKDPIAIHYFSDLKAGEWNHLAWEIPEMRRDSVSEFSFFQPTFGVTGEEPRITYDIDDLALELVDAEQVQGWSIREGAISYSHLGYLPGANKIALASPGGEAFDILDSAGNIAASFPARIERNSLGEWASLDFSTFATVGLWRIRYGASLSHDFPISDHAWLPLVEATLSAFHGLRCGWAVDGVHGVCHEDVFTELNGDRRSVAGGWHDAANLTQGPGRTHLSIYALCELAQSLRDGGQTELAARAEEEAAWGVDWSLRMRFSAGIRVLYDDVSYYTDGIVGTDDDVLQHGRGGAGYDEFQNILAVLANARAARLVAESAPELSERLQTAATEDFEVTLGLITPPTIGEPVGINESSWRDRIGYFCLAAVELFRITRDSRYRTLAIELGQQVLNTQEQRFVDGIAVAGYFYEDPARTRIVHEYHDGFEDSGLLALAALQAEFGDDPEWISWYSGLATYADHFARPGSTASAPFGVLPAAVWRLSDIDSPHPHDPVVDFISAHASPLFPTPPTRDVVRGQMLEMFDDGVDLGADYRLRRFPLWSDRVRHGSTTIQLGKSIGLAAAARSRRSIEDHALSTRQLEWVVGANPFSRSLVYGVGRDWWQNFAVELVNLVGGLSLGFNSYEDDSPAWGNNAVFPYKEQWVYASSRLAMMLSFVGAPARVVGDAPHGAALRNLRTGAEHSVDAGHFAISLPSGTYEVAFGGATRTVDLVASEVTQIDLDPSRWIELSLSASADESGSVKVELGARGSGVHTVTVLASNLRLSEHSVILDLSDGAQAVALNGDVLDSELGWRLVAIPHGNRSCLAEVGGPLAASFS